MQKADIKPGTNLRLRLDSLLEVQPNFELHSIFEGSEGDFVFIISAPMHRGAFYPINVDELLYLSYYNDLARYDFQGVVLERFSEGEVRLLKIRQATEVVRTQRREDYRLDISFRGALEYEEFSGTEYETKKVTYFSLDLSGGGIAVFLNVYFGLGKKVVISLPAEEFGEALKFECEVRWMHKNVKDGIYKYIVGLKFFFRTEREKQGVIKYIFKKQRKRLKKNPNKSSVVPLRGDWD